MELARGVCDCNVGDDNDSDSVTEVVTMIITLSTFLKLNYTEYL